MLDGGCLVSSLFYVCMFDYFKMHNSWNNKRLLYAVYLQVEDEEGNTA